MGRIFDSYTEKHEFTTLRADGFSERVPGVVFTEEKRPCCGVPLGGIGTGCIDFDLRGVWGWSTLFFPVSQMKDLGSGNDPRTARRMPDVQPALAFSVGETCYIAATEEIRAGGRIPWCTAPGGAWEERDRPQAWIDLPELAGVRSARKVEYYGHYPMADAEYAFDVPVSLGVRAWSSFIVGDAARSNIPAAFFEVRLRNESDAEISGSLAMNFPGMNAQEARSTFFEKRRVEERAAGMYVCSEGGVNYFLGVMGKENVMTGTGLMPDTRSEHGYGDGMFAKPNGFARLGHGLSQDERYLEQRGTRLYRDSSAAAAVSYCLKPGEEKKTVFVLCWYAPVIEGSIRLREKEGDVPKWLGPTTRWAMDPACGEQSWYAPMYAARYGSALDVMRRVSMDHAGLYRRVLAWQQALLTRDDLPGWLRDSLLNIFCLLTENGYWFQPRYPLGDWAFPDGAFVYYESARDCPHTGCIPNDWISSVYIACFFPDLYRQMVRSYKAQQKEDGEIPFSVGRLEDVPNLAYPEYFWQMSLNGTSYIMMVDRLWRMTRDDRVLAEFYPSMKKCHDFMRGLSEKGWLAMPDRGGSEWFEWDQFYGITSHVGGLHLNQLLLMERAANAMGDETYAVRCRDEFEKARAEYEEKLWCGTHYRVWLDEESGKSNDDVMAYQFDGYYCARQAGITEQLYDAKRMETGLDTIFRATVPPGNGYGAVNYARPDGRYAEKDGDTYGAYCIFTQSNVVLAMTDMYADPKKRERAMDLIYRAWHHLVIDLGLGWDMTHAVSAQSGLPQFGTDYNQQSVIWSIPAALCGGEDMAACLPGGVADDMLKAVRACDEYIV